MLKSTLFYGLLVLLGLTNTSEYKLTVEIYSPKMSTDHSENSMVGSLKKIMKEQGSDAHLIIHTDEHLSEYPIFNFVQPISNFSGSNAQLLMILKNDEFFIYCYTDGRYFLQAENELTDFKLKKIGEDDRLSVFLKGELEELSKKRKVKVTVDMKMVAKSAMSTIKETVGDGFEFVQFSNEDLLSKIPKNLLHSNIQEAVKGKLVDLGELKLKNVLKIQENAELREYCEKMLKNLPSVDQIFENMSQYKPETKFLFVLKQIFEDKKFENLKDLYDFPVTFLTYEEKLKLLRSFMKEDDVMLLTDLSDIAWLLNFRTDQNETGNFLSWCVITQTNAILFTDLKITRENLEIHQYSKFWKYFDQNLSSANVKDKNMKIFVSTDYSAYIDLNLGKNKIETSILRDLKAIKNDIELIGMLQANIIDGVGLTNLFFNLQREIKQNGKSLSEIEIGKMVLDQKRKATKHILGDENLLLQHSFSPIVGSGPKSAVIHYRPHDKKVEKDVLLLDTGAQYVFGTTDITRTIHFGDMSDNEKFKKYFTLVLKGVLTSARLTASKAAFSSLFENSARVPLFQDLTEYLHGTSHGVGHSNTVHENKSSGKDAQTRNVFSLELGAYFSNEFGIRIENCVVSTLKNVNFPKFITTMSLTFVPLQRDLIEPEMLSQEEKNELNEYNRNIRKFIGPYLEKEQLDWLMEETKEF